MFVDLVYFSCLLCIDDIYKGDTVWFALQAIHWIEELCDVTNLNHYRLGDNSEEANILKEDNRNIKDTAVVSIGNLSLFMSCYSDIPCSHCRQFY